MNKIFITLIFLLIFLHIGKVVTDNPILPMNASLINYYSITISDELAKGIWFTNLTGSVENIQYPLVAGTFKNNATFNYNKTDQKTGYWIYESGNLKIDLCSGAKYNLCSNLTCYGGVNEEIDIGNVTWSSSSLNDVDNPSMSGSTSMVLGYDNSNKIVGLDPKSYAYLRYWLDVPSGYPPYNYSTIYQIQAVPAGDACA